VTGDVAGYAAATFMRGMPLVQVPTTVLAMADASIGGKTGVNLGAAKNLVGAFKQPRAVVIDPGFLRSLPDEELANGLAEVVKAGVIGDPALLEALARGGAPPKHDGVTWAELIRRAVAVKAEIVSADPLESGRRAVLNLGHTFGHGLESASGFRVRHGEAVAVGMVAAAHVAARLGLAGWGVAEVLTEALLRVGLPVRHDGPAPELVLEHMGIDKKRRAGRLRFVLPLAIGSVQVVDDVPDAIVLDVLDDLRA
jgi:3-dehydroquinate synthetase